MSPRRSGPRRLLIAVGLLLLIAISVSVTWIASGRIRSPAEVAARTVAPEPSPILVPVEMRTISSDVVTRGTGRFGAPQTLRVAPSSLKPTSYVDTVPALGGELDEGDVALTASGRPIIILRGIQPMFRDLGPGMTGSDVLQLEDALERLGFPPGELDGTYDLETQVAVSEWYRSTGFVPIAATADQQAAIRSIEADLTALEREVLGAAEATAAVEIEVLAAREAHRAASLAAAGAQDAVASARAEAEAANAAAEGEVALAEGAVALAWRQLPPIHAPEEEHNLALAEWENLRTAAATAQAGADLVRATGDAAIRDAERAAAAAPGEVANAAAAVAAAETKVGLARETVGLTESSMPQLTRDLTLAGERAGIQVPANEIVFVAETPVRVSEVHVARGDEIAGPLLSVTNTVVAIDGTLALDQVGLVGKGAAVSIEEADLGIRAGGVISAVADGPGTRGADGFHVWFETLVTESPEPISKVVGASVRLTISVESSDGPVLAVPASALTLTMDGSTVVQVDRNGTLERVTVEPGLAASGYVAVLVEGNKIEDGDLVVIGFEAPAVTGG